MTFLPLLSYFLKVQLSKLWLTLERLNLSIREISWLTLTSFIQNLYMLWLM